MDFLLQNQELSPTGVTIAIMIVYIFLLWIIAGRKRNTDKRLCWIFAVVALLGFVWHLMIFSKVVADPQFSQYDNQIIRVLFSIQYSLEMFLGNTIIIKDEVSSAIGDCPLLYHGSLILYGMAVITSVFAAFHFLSRGLYTWIWLKFAAFRLLLRRFYTWMLMWLKKKQAETNAHIFVGINDASKCLATDIKNGQVIFIDIPKQDGLQSVSIMDMIARFFKTGEEQKWLDKYVVLRAGKGIRKIKEWLAEPTTTVYLLSDDQAANIADLEKLYKDPFQCKIYCHAKKEGIVNRYDSITDSKDRITFVDSSFLAVETLKKRDSMLPVHYVKIAQDDKRSLGYVTSSFNCAVVGFGETGKEALKFLYEFGAFPTAKNGKAPFKCHIFDGNLDKELGEFGVDINTLKSSVAQDREFETHPHYVGTSAFRSEMSCIVKGLNYVVVSLGDDNLNIETALSIAECALAEGKPLDENFCIAVRLTAISKLNEDTIAEANRTFGNWIKIFGLPEHIWKLSIISNKDHDAAARKFYESYKMHSDKLNQAIGYDPDPTWDEREKMLCEGTYEKRCEIRRKRAQDYSNSLHVTTKRKLCEGYNTYDTHDTKVVDQILYANKGKVHCEGNYCEILEHLAVCEHLRWEASHMIMGYRPVEKDGDPTEELKKLHKYIKPYLKIEEFHIRHYDWLVVKNSL